MALIWNGQPVPGTERVISFLDDPTLPNWAKRQKHRAQSSARPPGARVEGVGIHTFRAARSVLVPFDPTVHRLRARECIRIHAGSSRAGAYHLYVDHDGTIYQCADPVLRAAYHGAGNAWTCGIGITQGSRRTPRSAPDVTVTTNAVDAAAWLAEVVISTITGTSVDAARARGFAFAGFKPRVPSAKAFPRQRIPEPLLERLRPATVARYGALVIGHCHTGTKTHDPGEHVWARLGARTGWRQVWP